MDFGLLRVQGPEDCREAPQLGILQGVLLRV